MVTRDLEAPRGSAAAAVLGWAAAAAAPPPTPAIDAAGHRARPSGDGGAQAEAADSRRANRRDGVRNIVGVAEDGVEKERKHERVTAPTA